MPKLSIIDSLRQRGKRSIPSDILKAGSILSLEEGSEILLTYTSAVDKMKFFSAFIREGLESGDAVWYTYPHEESETVRAELRKYGINTEKYERNGVLHLTSLTEDFMPNGKLDYKQAVTDGIDWWNEAKRKGYKHARGLEDYGDFSVFNGEWQKFITDYYLDPRWDDPNTSEWVLPDVSPEQQLGVVMSPFLMEITAVNVERMTQKEVNELLKALSGASVMPSHAFIDLFEYVNSFSKSIGLGHRQLVGRNILLEFDPSSHYEKVVDNLAKESRANVEPFFVFTPSTSPIHKYLAKQPVVKFFLTSFSTSTPKSTFENEVLLPAKNTPLILDAISKVVETHEDVNVCFVLDILTDLLTSIGQEKTFTFLRHALDMLSSKKTTSFFLLNTSAHDTEVVSRIRGLFQNIIVYNRNGLEIVKTS